MQQGGKNRRDLRERYLRIRGLTIGVQRSSGRIHETQVMPIIRRSRLPSSISPGEDGCGFASISRKDEDGNLGNLCVGK